MRQWAAKVPAAVVAEARVQDSLSGSSFGLAYRLEVTRSEGRWYVERVEGALS